MPFIYTLLQTGSLSVASTSYWGWSQDEYKEMTVFIYLLITDMLIQD